MSDASEFGTGRSEAFRKRWGAFVLVGITLIVAFLLSARPLYHNLKRWRARQLASQAERLLSGQKWTEASEKAQGAFLLCPTEPDAIRAVATLETEAGLPSAQEFWQTLLATGRATPTDRRSYVAAALHSGAPGRAHAELARLLTEEPDQPADLWLLARVCLAEGDPSAAGRFAAAAAAGDPTNRQYRLFAATLSFDAAQAGPRSNARQVVWSLGREADAVGLQAIEFLASRRDLSADQFRELASLLDKHPLRRTADRLLALALRLREQPARRAQVLDAATDAFAHSDPADRRDFGAWLNQQGEFSRTLAVLPLAEARQRMDLFIVHLDALASLGRWTEIEALLKDRTAPLPPVYREAFQARCALQLKDPGLAAACWRRALAAAENNLPDLWWLADYAGKNGEVGAARKAYRAWMDRVRDPRPGYQALTRLIEQTGTTAELRDLLGETLQRWPDDPALRNDHAYLSLLLGEELARCRRTAEELVAQNPDSLPHRTTLALARYRLKDFPGALQVYAGQDYDWQAALPGNRAVYAAVLAANHATAEARRLARGLPAAALRPEEAALVQPLQEKNGVDTH